MGKKRSRPNRLGPQADAVNKHAGQFPGLQSVVQIAAGAFHTCALLVDGSVQCWGLNRDYELGAPGVPDASDSFTPILGHASLKVTIQARSLAMRDDISDKDRREIERIMQEEILESSAYPEIVYECSDIAERRGPGIHRCVKRNPYSAWSHAPSVFAGASSGSGRYAAGFWKFSILQTDYDLKLVTVAGGALKVKDELKFSFNILARKKE